MRGRSTGTVWTVTSAAGITHSGADVDSGSRTGVKPVAKRGCCDLLRDAGSGPQDEVMASLAEVPLVDGPADGTTVTVELDAAGRPPLTHHFTGGNGLVHAAIYELEAVAGGEPPWLYRWRTFAS